MAIKSLCTNKSLISFAVTQTIPVGGKKKKSYHQNLKLYGLLFKLIIKSADEGKKKTQIH